MDAAGSADARDAWLRLRELAAAPDVVDAEHALMHDVGLTAGPVRTLRALLDEDAQPMSGLARAMGCDSSYVTGLVKTLTARKLVEAVPSPSDGRVRVVRLTGEGRAVAERARRVYETPPSALLGLPEARLRELATILGALGGDAE
jgi:DNA-binding MarR family transcriptional regulator